MFLKWFENESLKKSHLLFSKRHRENVISRLHKRVVFLFLKSIYWQEEKNSNNGGFAAFCLIHDSADSTQNQIILQKTDKLDSDWDETMEFSKYPQILLSHA